MYTVPGRYLAWLWHDGLKYSRESDVANYIWNCRKAINEEIMFSPHLPIE